MVGDILQEVLVALIRNHFSDVIVVTLNPKQIQNGKVIADFGIEVVVIKDLITR